MGMGLNIEVTEYKWPEETINVICTQCGSGLALTRFKKFPFVPVPTGETEQYCPQCGMAACEEDEGVKTIVAKNRKRDFFSAFHE